MKWAWDRKNEQKVFIWKPKERDQLAELDVDVLKLLKRILKKQSEHMNWIQLA
jgi:hypothetical protein